MLLAFIPFGLAPLAWVALVPLFVMIEPGKRLKNFLSGYLGGVLFFGGLIWWIGYVTPPGVVVLVLILGLYFGLTSLLLGFIEKDGLRAFALVPLWVFLEYFRSAGILGFSWGCIAHSQYQFLPLIQMAGWTGIYGISAAMVSVSAALGYLWLRRRTWKRSILPLATVLAVLMFICGMGYIRMSLSRSGKSLDLALIQGNVLQDEKWDRNLINAQIGRHLELIEEAADGGARLVVLSETVFPVNLESEEEFKIQISDLARQRDIYLLFGALHVPDERTAYNSAFMVSPDSVTGEAHFLRYDKMRLVPFGEYVPFKEFLPFVNEMVEGAGGGAFSCGTKPVVFQVDEVALSVLICFESTAPPVARKLVQSGARGLVVLTNDEWFKRSGASLQHASQSVFRAVENRVPVVRATNTGLTCIIDAEGRITEALPRFEESILQERVVFPDTAGTFYTRWGDWFAWICLFSAAGCFALEFKRRKRR